METRKRWYKRKRPDLQIDILEILAINGKLTKSMTEKLLKRRHASIDESFEKLEDIKFIEKMGHGAYKPTGNKIFFQLTDMGLGALIDEYARNYRKCWDVLTGYCLHHDKYLGDEKVRKLIALFKEKISTYKYQGYKIQLNIFDQTLRTCLESFIHNVDGISYGQIILEILSIKRGLTFRQLVDETKFSETEISKLLSLYTLEGYEPLKDNRVYISPNIPMPIPSDGLVDMSIYIEDQVRKKYSDFFLHCLIIPLKSDGDGGEKKYDLSLYGLMVVIALIRYQDMGKLKYGLFHKEMIFPDYLDKIAKNYQDKLPLIFGKWEELKKVLRLFTEYNFDIIINKEFRQRAFNTMHLAEGGNKELLYGIEQIALQNSNRLFNFVFAGEISIRNYIDRWHKPYDNISILREILNELTITIHPIESAFNEFSVIQYEIDKDISRKYLKEIVVPKYEKMLEWEISSIYYFNLYSDVGFSKKLNHPMLYFSTSQNKELIIPIDTNPKDCLKSIFEIDKQNPVISAWFYEVMEDLHFYRKSMDENMRSFLAK